MEGIKQQAAYSATLQNFSIPIYVIIFLNNLQFHGS